MTQPSPSIPRYRAPVGSSTTARAGVGGAPAVLQMGHGYEGAIMEEEHDVEILLRWEAELLMQGLLRYPAGARAGLLRYPSGAWAADMWEARREEIQWELHVLHDHGEFTLMTQRPM